MTEKQIRIAITLFIFGFLNFKAFGHGEEKPGPNGGYIRMPGGFHTELVKINDQKFKVYLFDINWKKPTIEKSSVEAIVKYKASETPVLCKPEGSFFTCELEKGKSLKSAEEITLKATRENTIGVPVKYSLPLSLYHL